MPREKIVTTLLLLSHCPHRGLVARLVDPDGNERAVPLDAMRRDTLERILHGDPPHHCTPKIFSIRHRLNSAVAAPSRKKPG